MDISLLDDLEDNGFAFILRETLLICVALLGVLLRLLRKNSEIPSLLCIL